MSQHIPQEVIEEIRSQTNIVDLVGQYVQLKKSGKNYVGLCPFHNEKTPSFSVVEEKQIFHCFGCGKGGNIFTFIEEIDGLTFPEAVKKVSELGQVQVGYDFNSGYQGESSERHQYHQGLLKLHDTAAELYHHILVNTQAGEQALAYLISRGLTESLIKEFQIGFAPQERMLLQQIFNNEKISSEELSESGLMTQRDDGTWLDRFYHRIMFPIRNAQGKVIAFSGRILEKEGLDTSKMPKYLNSPETPLFNKRQVLFNFDQARSAIRKENELVLFEGFMDVIASWQAGIKNGVASMGTSLTNEQIQMIQKTTNRVVICYDGDSAGVEATNRAVDILREQTKLELSIVSLPDRLDPDDFIRKLGSERFVELMKNRRDTTFTFKMNYLKQGKNLQNEQERFSFLQLLVQELVKVPSIIEKEVYINQIAQEYKVSPEAISEEVQELSQVKRRSQRDHRERQRGQGKRPEISVPKEQQIRHITAGEKAEQMLLFRILNERRVQSRISQLTDFSFVHDDYQELYHHFSDFMLTHGNFQAADFLNYVKEDHLKKQLVQISYQELSEESTEKEISDYIWAIAYEKLEQIKQKKLLDQKEASRSGNKQLEQELAVELINIQRQLKQVR